MKSPIFFSPVLLLLSLFFITNADVPRGYVTNPGTVVDSSGNPVRNAYISYVTLPKRFTWSWSDNNGNFGGTVGIGHQLPAALPASALRLSVQGNRLSFFVSRGSHASVELFDIQGRSLGAVLDKTMDQQGYFSFSPFAGSKKQWAHTVYTAKVSVDGKSECVKMVNQFGAVSGHAFSQSDPREINKLGKIAAFIDTVRVGKTGYYSNIVPISNYTDPVGTIKIVKMDVAGKVDSIFALMTPAEKGMAVTEGNFDDGANASGVGLLYAGGADGPGGHDISNWTTFTKAQIPLVNATRLHIPIICGVDNVHGLCTCNNGVILPHNCAMGCTWDPQFCEKAYRMVGCEIRGTGQDWMLAPCVAVCRDDRYGRLYEGYSENPDLTAAIAKSAVLGLSTGDLGHPNAVGVCCKHFCGDGGSTNGTMAGPCDTSYEHVTYEQLKYIHLLPYIECFKVYAISIMDQFGSWMGTTAPRIRQ